MYEIFQRRDDRRQFAIVVSSGIPRIICAIDRTSCQRLVAYRRGSVRGFGSVMYVIPKVTYR